MMLRYPKKTTMEKKKKTEIMLYDNRNINTQFYNLEQETMSKS